MAQTLQSGGPLAYFQGEGSLGDQFQKLKDDYTKWVLTQPPIFEAASTGFFNSLQGAFLGAVMGNLATMNPEAPGETICSLLMPSMLLLRSLAGRSQHHVSSSFSSPPPDYPSALSFMKFLSLSCFILPCFFAGGGPTAQMMKMGGPLQQARNFAVMTGLNAGIGAYMKRIRGVDDIQNS
jgi:hypothetical protein